MSGDSRRSMNTMKRILISIGILCLLLAGTVGWLARENMVKSKVIQNLDTANLALAYGLLADGLARNQVDIYASENAPAASYSVGNFTVRVVPLSLNTNRSTWGLANFLAHNHQAVLMHACHNWNLDRELAILQLTLLSQLRPEAQAILDDYHEHGKLTTTRGSIIDLHESQWNWFVERFSPQTEESSNKASEDIGANAPNPQP